MTLNDLKGAFTQRTALDGTGRCRCRMVSSGIVRCRALCERLFSVSCEAA